MVKKWKNKLILIVNYTTKLTLHIKFMILNWMIQETFKKQKDSFTNLLEHFTVIYLVCH